MRDPERDLEVNCLATLYLLEACRFHNSECRIIHTSTRQVYGIAETLPATENCPTCPIDVNGINKLAAEYYHLLYHRIYGIKSVVLRLTNTYGPRQQIKNNRQGFVGIFIRQALTHEPIKIFGTGEQKRDFNYVDDVVEALLIAGATEQCFGHVYNLGSPHHYSLLQFVALLEEYADIKHTLVPFPAEKAIIDIGDFFVDYSMFKKLTGWSPKVELRSGLAKTLQFYKEHFHRYI